ncbi:cobalamin biosynthesis protein CobT [Halomonas sp. 18H]|uniref:cobaltochelatase CobT-related protein n=1 Tax=Halomonas almeriensis TaxID=308163 RepID=UPI0022316532|nr:MULTISPECIES: cobalamin biosynthesis protein CobT [Halomonas]MCW4149227.1 cobalamin biosynthesis protein CobT [Halomonas sp. 18H]MDN3552223.1 cobalamin biosynthesis protein CobT [Halomonas almeriensis]
MTASAQQQALRQQRIEELCAASLRALTGDADLHYRGRRLYRGEVRLPTHAPHLRIDPGQDNFADCRAVADGMALRLLHSDTYLHRRLRPEGSVERLIFELLEQLRTETRTPRDMPGMRDNLHRRFSSWSRDFYRSGLTEGSIGMLVYTVAQMGWSRLNACPVLEETEDYIESTRASLVNELGTALAGLRRHRDNQAAYAEHALAIARIVGDRVRVERAQADEDDPGDADETTREAFALLLDLDDAEGDDDGVAAATTGHSKVFEDTAQTYRVFTTRYDREVTASHLVRRALLREYREHLDRATAEQGINLPRLARRLATVLCEPRPDGRAFGEEEGHIDGRRLAQLVSSPTERRLFYRDQHKLGADCAVSLLIDCSGSMKHHIEPVTLMAESLIRALEMIGASTELLGFTTGAWNGGRAYKDWMRQGRPRHPGRLNEVCHLVVKSAERSWRRARNDIAALLKPDLFREGIDGEAVDWACERLLGRPESRRMLIVISDGCPADSATNLTNDTYYLDNHLKDVIARRTREGHVEILGLGVGLDLSPFYRRCLATDMTQALDSHLFDEIVALIGGRHRR